MKVQGGGIPAGTRSGWPAARSRWIRPATSWRRRSSPRAPTPWRWRCSTRPATATSTCATSEFKRRDLFYVGMADLTVSENRADGPAEELQGENAPQPIDSGLDGRLAFYVNGKVTEQWHLTASADTREGPLKDIFSNLDKSLGLALPAHRPDYHYPTFGDDSVVEEMAPTLGKFYVKASKGENYGLGQLQGRLPGERAGPRGPRLYGANGRYVSQSATSFGERKFAADAFAAEPGTVSSYEEYRGTGIGLLPPSPGHPPGLRARARRSATRTPASSRAWSTCGR